MSTRHRLAAGAAAAVALGVGGAAVAATSGSPQQESRAIVADAAKQLGVSADELAAALRKALADRVDAAVSDGRLTTEQASELKARIQSGDVPLVGLGPGLGHRGGGFGRHLDAAAAYLGLTEAELRTRLEAGETLADVAKAEGKSVEGLVRALVDDDRPELDAAVAAGRVTDAQRTALLAAAEQRMTDLVNGALPFRGGPHGAPLGAAA